MITNKEFIELIDKLLGLKIGTPDNSEQFRAITYSGDRVLQIVAGPGSGKTSVLTLRALRFVFVEGMLPEEILITTFTRKAAKEIRTRWLDWGTEIAEYMEGDSSFRNKVDLNKIDLNRCNIDTLDSIAHQVLTNHRLAGELAPVVAEASTSNLILKRTAFRDIYSGANKLILDELLKKYTFEGDKPRNRGEALKVTKSLVDRLVQDRVNSERYSEECKADELKAHALVVEMLRKYSKDAHDTNVYDHSLLEARFLERLVDESLKEWTNELKVLLIDEYQDTNPLQEEIYFTILGYGHIGSTIVGDDDQSMYRFRGGSVELFTQFAERCQRKVGRATERIDMVRNFRSTPEIIEFYNEHITTDPEFTQARIRPHKPLVSSTKKSELVPVLGMFREDPETLARVLTDFLCSLVNDGCYYLEEIGQEIRMRKDGDLGDVVFLSHTVKEIVYNRFARDTKKEKEYFPHWLRQSMYKKKKLIFNPRGQTLRSIPDVATLLGLLLIVADPDDDFSYEARFTGEARYFLDQWRGRAIQFIEEIPSQDQKTKIKKFIDLWKDAARGGNSHPSDWPILEIVYRLLEWLPKEFQTEPEHQVWLEAITRCIAGAGMASPYGMRFLQGSKAHEHVRRSRLSFVRDALVPIAEDEVDADEDIMPNVPRDRLQIMTIHQSKGLEFPLVIVDVGSRFKTNHPKQRFLRFPTKESNVVQAEDDVEPYLEEPLRIGRSAIDRTFDDLVRLYYVAYSRPESVLLLVGNEKCLFYGKGKEHKSGAIPNISLGWHRDGEWPWRQPYEKSESGRKTTPPVRVSHPFLLI